MMNRRRINLVELYLNGRMSAQDIQEFHKQLETDPKLRDLLQQEQKIEQALRHDRQSIPSMGAQRLEQLLQTGARNKRGGGRGPMDPSASINKSPQIMEMTLVDRARRWLSSREFKFAMTGVGVVLVALFLLQKNNLNIAEPAAAHGSPAILPASGSTSDSLLLRPHGSTTDGAPMLADSFTSPVPANATDGISPDGNTPLTSDSPHANGNGTAGEKYKGKQRQKQKTTVASDPAVSTDDGVEEMLRRMEKDEKEGAVRQKTSDSVRARFQMKQKK